VTREYFYATKNGFFNASARHLSQINVFLSAKFEILLLTANGIQEYKKDTTASWTCTPALFPVPLYQQTAANTCRNGNHKTIST